MEQTLADIQPPVDAPRARNGSIPVPCARRREVPWVPVVANDNPPNLGPRLYTWQQLKNLPPQRWLIDRKLPEGVSRLYGPSNIGKTFVALDMGLALALAGHLVVYIAGEGKAGIPKRVRAWLAERGQEDAALDNFVVHDGPVDMLSPHAVQEFVSRLRGRKPVLIIVDTLARCFAGGDENSAKDVGLFVRHCDLLRESWPGASVLVLHHSGKNERRGGRGSSAGLGAVDCDMVMEKAGRLVMLRCAKMRDGDPFKPELYELVARHGSCVLVPAKEEPCTKPKGVDPKTVQRVLKALADGPLGWAAVRDKVKVSQSTATRALGQLQKGGQGREAGGRDLLSHTTSALTTLTPHRVGCESVVRERAQTLR